jgi:hypothetical protein
MTATALAWQIVLLTATPAVLLLCRLMNTREESKIINLYNISMYGVIALVFAELAITSPANAASPNLEQDLPTAQILLENAQSEHAGCDLLMKQGHTAWKTAGDNSETAEQFAELVWKGVAMIRAGVSPHMASAVFCKSLRKMLDTK